MNTSTKKVIALLFFLLVSTSASAKDKFSVCWSIYAGFMPWAYAQDSGIMDKWADKYDIDIEIVQINDYVESINQYTTGQFDGCAMTNIDALTIPAVGGIDSTMLIVGDYSNGNDAVILKDKAKLEDIKGQNVNLVKYSVSHYFLARALSSVGMTERDIRTINTSDADMVSIFGTDSVTSVVTWNPMTSDILALPNTYNVYDSSMIPGEIIDGLVVNTKTLEQNPDFGKALVGAWYETLAKMQGDSEAAENIRTMMAAVAETDLKGFDAQLAKTYLYYSPKDAAELSSDSKLLQTMTYVAEFSYDQGLLGNGAPNAGIIGIEMPAGVYGDSSNIKLRFDPTYMQMAADGTL
jgi:NitT/TauT family transport system substrate-binding protein